MQAALEKIDTLLNGGAQGAQVEFADLETTCRNCILGHDSFATAVSQDGAGRNRYSDVMALEKTR